MKSFVLIAVLAALTVYNEAASILDEVAPYGEEIVMFQESGQEYRKTYYPEGVAGRNRFLDEDLVMFLEEPCFRVGIPNTVQTCNVVFTGNSTTRISVIGILNHPVHPGRSAVGNFWTHGYVNLTSAPGVGIFSTVQFMGRYTDWL